jgi:hypothetical protein
MRRRSATIAAVVVIIAIIAVAVGAIWWMNPGWNFGRTGGSQQASDSILPSGPEGSVNGVVADASGTNESNASGLADLQAEFNATSGATQAPDALAKVAVANNRTDDITLNTHNFAAKLENGSSVQALNTAQVTIPPNTTELIVLGFVTNGANITSISYSDDNVSFTPVWTKVAVPTLPEPVIRSAPNGTLNASDNVTFAEVNAWRVQKGGWAPMSARFDNQSMVIALLTVTNNRTGELALNPNDFWLDMGNGSWVQADQRANNNVPKTVGINTTMPFLLGFRGVENVTPAAIYYWPANGTTGDRIPLALNQTPSGNELVLFRVGNSVSMPGATNASGNATGNNLVVMDLLVVGDGASSAGLSGVKAYTLNHGQVDGIVIPTTDQNLSSTNASLHRVAFNLDKGDQITMVTGQVNGEPRYVWLRQLVPAS